MAMEAKPNLAETSLDAINAFGENERESLDAAIRAYCALMIRNAQSIDGQICNLFSSRIRTLYVFWAHPYTAHVVYGVM
jgi:hypothetical protein